MKETFLAGRIVLGAYLLFSGAHHFANLAQMSTAAAHHGVPMPMLSVAAAGVLLLIGGVSFLLGIFPKVGIAAMVLFLVPVTLLMHQYWREEGMTRMNDFINFTKNFGLLGAIVMFAAIPEPWPYSARSWAHRRAGGTLRPSHKLI